MRTPQFPRRTIGYSIIVVLLTLTVLITLNISWVWSTIDDPGLAISLNDRIAANGLTGGIARGIQEAALTDYASGRLRPSYWVYQSTAYLAGTEWMRVIRVLMLFAAVAGPVTALHRVHKDTRVTIVAAAILAISTNIVSQGIFFASLQELSGAAFVGLAFLARSPWLRLLLLVVAAGFKEPFAWTLIGYAYLLWRSHDRRLAVVSAASASVFLLIWFGLASSGSYTQSALGSPYSIVSAMTQNSYKLLDVNIILALLALLWWAAVSHSKLIWSHLSTALTIAFGGYTLMLLPWSLSGYYVGPLWYLGGLICISTLSVSPGMSAIRMTVALSVPVSLAIFSIYSAIGTVLQYNSTVDGAVKCISGIEGSPNVAVTGSEAYLDTPEAARRYAQIIEDQDSGWRGSIDYVSPTEFLERPGYTHDLWVGNRLPTTAELIEPVCVLESSYLYRRGASVQ